MATTVVWAARNCDERIPEVLELTRAADIQTADIAAPRIPYSVVVVNSEFPYKCFLSDWEKWGTPFYVISLDNSSVGVRVKDFSMCQDISYV